jgi:hypothetical protein
MSLNRTALAALLLSASVPVLAGDFDGSRALICAPSEAQDCAAEEGCTATHPHAIGAPAFVRIDFKKKALIGPQQATPIQLMDKSETQIYLTGVERGFSWTIALAQKDGAMTATLISDNGTFVLFGYCTPQ